MLRFARLGWCAAALATWVQADAQKVDLHVRPTSLVALVQRLEGLTGKKLGVSDELKPLIIMVNASQTTPDELMRQVAEAAAADWADREGKLVLRRSGARLAALEKANNQLRLDVLERSLRQFDKVSLEPLTEESAIRALQEQRDYYERMERGDVKKGERPPRELGDPNSRLMARIRTALPLADMIRLQPGDRVVYCTRPTAMQKPMGGALIGLLDQCRRESEIYASASQKVFNQNPPDEGAVPPSQDGAAPVAAPETATAAINRGPEAGPCTVATLAISRTEGIFSGMFQISICGYDQKGNMVASANHTAMISMQDIDAEESDSEPAEQPAKTVQFPLNPFSLEIKKMTQGWSDGGATQPSASPELLKYLMDPVQYEPLDSLGADGLDYLAKNEKRNVVAVMDDGWFLLNLMTNEYRSHPDPLRMFGTLFSNKVVDGEWVRYTPFEMRNPGRLAMSRQFLATFLRSAKDNGYVSLDDMARYSAQISTPLMENMGVMYLWLVDPAIASGVFRSGSQAWLDVYGALPTSLRDDLRRGSQLSYQRLPSGAKASLYRMIYGVASGEAQEYNDGDAPEDMSADSTVATPAEESDATAWLYEPTFALPNNIPANALLTAKVTENTVLYSHSANTPIYMRGMPIPPRTLGYLLAAREMNQGGDNEVPSEFVIGRETRWTFRFQAGPKMQRTGTLTDIGKADWTKKYTLDTLPESIKAQILKYKEEYKRSMDPNQDEPVPPTSQRP